MVFFSFLLQTNFCVYACQMKNIAILLAWLKWLPLHFRKRLTLSSLLFVSFYNGLHTRLYWKKEHTMHLVDTYSAFGFWIDFKCMGICLLILLAWLKWIPLHFRKRLTPSSLLFVSWKKRAWMDLVGTYSAFRFWIYFKCMGDFRKLKCIDF